MAELKNITDVELHFNGEEKKFTVSAKQGDKATRYVRATILQEDNTEYKIPDGYIAIVNIQKPDRHFCYNECAIQDNKVIIQLTNQALAAAGTAHADVEIRNAANTLVLSTQSFEIEIEKSQRDDSAILSSNELTALESKVQKYIDDLIKTKEEVLKVEEAVKIAEEARKQAENDRTTAESDRQANEAARQQAENDRQQKFEEYKTVMNDNTAIAKNSASSAKTSADSAKNYYEQAKEISETLSGALRPMGTVTFANLPALSLVASGNMYNISDQFTTTNDFKEGAGNTIPAGANVYKTEDGKWDILAGTPVTGVKGSAESEYRRGNVDITAENVGAVPLGGNAGSADRAARLGRNGNAGYPMTFNWAGKTGQPSWLWGGENGEDMYVYNPSNFSVNYAASAGNAAKVNGHTVNSDVPSGAKFTDTNTWRPLGTGGDDACAGNDSRLSNARPASDVYAWAKASAKPTYNKAEVGLGNVDNTADSVKSVNYATSAGNAAKVNGHSVNADVPSNAKFTDTDTKGTCLSGRSSAYGWSVNRLSSGYLIEAFHTAAQNYTMTNQYGNMYWASFEITIPQSNNIKFFDAINITPFATSGLISVSITNYTTSKIQGFVFSPLAETKSISFHVTLHGTTS